ncbi:MAG: 4Fe-4S binding protein [Nitrososphaerota archaeon]|nr:4Fe-4S binding protein [Nitrososphaerota archaeon]
MNAQVVEGVPKALVVVDSERCKGCELCVVTCPHKNLKLSEGLNKIGYHPVQFSYLGEKGACTACGICYWACPDFAIAEVRSLKEK